VIGVYELGIALRHFGLELLPAIVLTFAVGLIIAAAVGSLSLRVTGISFAMVTLAFAQAGSVLIRKNPGKLTGGDEGLPLDTSHVPDLFVGVLQTKNLYWLCLAVLVVVAAAGTPSTKALPWGWTPALVWISAHLVLNLLTILRRLRTAFNYITR